MNKVLLAVLALLCLLVFINFQNDDVVKAGAYVEPSEKVVVAVESQDSSRLPEIESISEGFSFLDVLVLLLWLVFNGLALRFVIRLF